MAVTCTLGNVPRKLPMTAARRTSPVSGAGCDAGGDAGCTAGDAVRAAAFAGAGRAAGLIGAAPEPACRGVGATVVGATSAATINSGSDAAGTITTDLHLGQLPRFPASESATCNEC